MVREDLYLTKNQWDSLSPTARDEFSLSTALKPTLHEGLSRACLFLSCGPHEASVFQGRIYLDNISWLPHTTVGNIWKFVRHEIFVDSCDVTGVLQQDEESWLWVSYVYASKEAYKQRFHIMSFFAEENAAI